jgi:hypothetical protein
MLEDFRDVCTVGTRAALMILDPQNWVFLAGFGHAVSETRLSCAEQGRQINLMARHIMEQQAFGNRRAATRDLVRQKQKQNEENNHC